MAIIISWFSPERRNTYVSVASLGANHDSCQSEIVLFLQGCGQCAVAVQRFSLSLGQGYRPLAGQAWAGVGAISINTNVRLVLVVE